MKQEGFKISQYACAVLLIVSSIALVAYQVIEIEDVAAGLLYYVAQSFLLAGSIFGLDQYVRNIKKRYQDEKNAKKVEEMFGGFDYFLYLCNCNKGEGKSACSDP